MLNLLLHNCYTCPVCGRIIYGKLPGWWCPYCGRDLVKRETTEVSFSNRLTARTETGMPYYIGKHSFREKAFAQDLELSAIAEILEKLCQYEEIAEEEEKND